MPRPSADPNTSPQLTALAELMVRWAEVLPRWDAGADEPWFEFVERSYGAETALVRKLRGLPTCRLVLCPIREQVSLTLAGIEASTEKGGLGAACMQWARKARALASKLG